MWYPLATRNKRETVAALPWTAVTTGAGAIFTAGPCGPRSSCAQAQAANRRIVLARRIFIGLTALGIGCRHPAQKGRLISKLLASLKGCPDTNLLPTNPLSE